MPSEASGGLGCIEVSDVLELGRNRAEFTLELLRDEVIAGTRLGN